MPPTRTVLFDTLEGLREAGAINRTNMFITGFRLRRGVTLRLAFESEDHEYIVDPATGEITHQRISLKLEGVDGKRYWIRFRGVLPVPLPAENAIEIGTTSRLRQTCEPHLLQEAQNGVDLAPHVGSVRIAPCHDDKGEKSWVNIEVEIGDLLFTSLIVYADGRRWQPTIRELEPFLEVLPDGELPQSAA